jgi:anti-anti-sigma factor
VLGRHDPPLSVECRWEDRRATVVVRGEVDFATAGILARQLDEVAGQQPEHLTVDLGLTSFLDAAGLRVIARARRVLPPRCPLTLRSPTRHVRLVLEVSAWPGSVLSRNPASLAESARGPSGPGVAHRGPFSLQRSSSPVLIRYVVM